MTSLQKRILVLQSKADKEPDIIKRNKILQLILDLRANKKRLEWLAQ